MLPSITYLDLETTGATPTKDRITEIALVRFDNGIETARWETLVNPEQPIPPFIQNLTGINDQAVADAPVFAEVADKLQAFLEGTVLAAHNVRFDYGFIKAEFKRLGITIKQKVLCTVKLSRLLYPEHYSHGLDAIMKRHQITTIARHRAMGDVETVLAFLNIASKELGPERLESAAQQLMRGPSLPPHLDGRYLEEMPETPGVYLFYGENDLPLYIGKSNNIKTRVLSHFSGDHKTAKASRIAQSVKHIEWHDAAGDFSALLLESRLIKTKQPLYNRKLRQHKEYYSWQLSQAADDLPLCQLITHHDFEPDGFASYFGLFNSKRHAKEMLRKVVNLHRLCPIWVGLEQGKGSCFGSQVNQCKGVCAGKEPPEIHFLRLKQAMLKHRLKPWEFNGMVGVREQNIENGLMQLHVFSHWQYLGCVNDESGLTALRDDNPTFSFDADIYKLLLKTLYQPKTDLVYLG